MKPEAIEQLFARLYDLLEEVREAVRVLGEEAVRDPLTGIYSRRYLEERLEEEVARAERNGTPVSVLFLDIDDFKVFNDDHGHRLGDEFLRQFAGALRDLLREREVAGRYGGDEFLILLPDADSGQARQVADRILGQLPEMLDEALLASGGIACFPEHARTSEELMRQADAALYRAKRLGKGRVVVAGEGEGTRTRPATGTSPVARAAHGFVRLAIRVPVGFDEAGNGLPRCFWLAGEVYSIRELSPEVATPEPGALPPGKRCYRAVTDAGTFLLSEEEGHWTLRGRWW